MIIIYLSLLSLFPPDRTDVSSYFVQFMTEFDQEYASLGIRFSPFDYRDELQAIPDLGSINAQKAFFLSTQKQLQSIDRKALRAHHQLQYDHLAYEIDFNLYRLSLETQFRTSAEATIPPDGLSTLPFDWYALRIKRYTSIDITPAELFEYGEAEVARVQREIRRIRNQLGYANDSLGFYKALSSESFVLSDKAEILRRYEKIEATVNQHLKNVFIDTDVSEIEFMEWPRADRFTPPGYYSPADANAYGVAVFHFNFFNERHNTRSMEWLYLHEAVPGHHYQWWMRNHLPEQPDFKRHFSYSGNFEGWAAYIEYLGKDLGVYQDPYSELGKWEWDLVRSTRIMIDVGIHHFGWSKDEAIECWMKHIPGQDEIAEREVVRCLNWPGQALSYKVGAWKIQQMAEIVRKEIPDAFSLPAFHRAYLMAGQTPLAVVEKHIKWLVSS